MMENELMLYAPFIKEIKELIYRHQDGAVAEKYKLQAKLAVKERMSIILTFWKWVKHTARRSLKPLSSRPLIAKLSKQI